MARGDHLVVRRFGGLYSHHGIDCGDGTVIHLTAAGRGAPGVERLTMEQFAEGDTVEVRDYDAFLRAASGTERALRDQSLALGRALDRVSGRAVDDPDTSPDAVVARAESRLGELGFDAWLNNCEHFATWCRTGVSNSAQVDAIWRLALGPVGYWLYKTNEALDATLDKPAK